MNDDEDFSTLETASGATEGRWFHPRNPRTGRLLKAEWLIYGTDSPEVRKHAMERIRERPGQDDDPETLRKKRFDSSAWLVGGWKDTEWAGEAIPFSHEEVVKLYTKCPWLADWVESIATDRANFLPPVSPS